MRSALAWLLGPIAAFALGACACAQEAKSRDAWWQEATAQPDAEIVEYSTFKLVRCCEGLTLYYFTKPSHAAHPGVIHRAIVVENGVWTSKLTGASFAGDRDQPAFHAWMNEISYLDLQLTAHLRGASAEAKAFLKAHPEIATSARCATIAESLISTLEEWNLSGKLGPADAAYLDPVAKLLAVAESTLHRQLAPHGLNPPAKADLAQAAIEANAAARGGSERVTRDCLAHFNIAAPRR